MERAGKSDWRTVDMPPERETFSLDMKLTEEEFLALKMGQVPREMEDKWFSFYEEDMLYVHRSWTGFCIYMIRFERDGRVRDVTVNRNPQQYRETSLEQDKIGAKLRINALTERSGNAELMRQYVKEEKRS